MGVAAALVGAALLTHLPRSPRSAGPDNEEDLSAEAAPRAQDDARLPLGQSTATVNQSHPAVFEASRTSPLLADDGASPAPAFAMPQVAEDVQIASPEVAGQIAEAEREMASQDEDPLRSAAMEARIYSEIAQKALGLEISYLQADCRTTLCRLQFALPKSFLEKKFGDVPLDAVWTGREPVSFFIKALDLEWRYTTAFGGVDRYGTPVVLGYVAMPSSPTPP
jgi:hypothetical protein